MSSFLELKKWFPSSWRLRSDGILDTVFFVAGKQLDDIDQAIVDAENQMAIQTATWSLSIYEKERALPVSPELPAELRRMRILAKEQGGGTPTRKRLENLLNEFVPDKSGRILIRHEEALIIAQVPEESTIWVGEALKALRDAAYARDWVIPSISGTPVLFLTGQEGAFGVKSAAESVLMQDISPIVESLHYDGTVYYEGAYLYGGGRVESRNSGINVIKTSADEPFSSFTTTVVDAAYDGSFVYDGSIAYRHEEYELTKREPQQTGFMTIYRNGQEEVYTIMGRYAITTKLGREAMAKARTGEAALPRVTHIAFGDGGADPAEPFSPFEPSENDTDLGNRVILLPINSQTRNETKVTYTCETALGQLNGKMINEAGLIDENGILVARKTFPPKYFGESDSFEYEWYEGF
jgi:hypothetical protein